MKVGIITLSASDNCGSLLQCYALQRLIEMRGHEVEIINFASVTSKKMYRSFHPGYIRNPERFIGQILRHRSVVRQIEDYKLFRKEYLQVTEKQYSSVEELKELDGKYAYVICGSDQVWNIYMHDFDPAFFLSWCEKSKRVAYAASLGDQKRGKLSDMEKAGLNLARFDAVSVREDSAVSKFRTELGMDVELCLDPTLILPKKKWENLVSKEKQPMAPYIFYYSYNYGNENKNMIVKEFAENIGLPVYVINASRWVDGREKKYGFRIYDDAGPLAFLNLMAGCEFSLVESFHGCIFSYLFEKQFFFLEDMPELDDRINDLLTVLDLKNRVIRGGTLDWVKYPTLNYANRSKRLTELAVTSENFIDRFFGKG